MAVRFAVCDRSRSMKIRLRARFKKMLSCKATVTPTEKPTYTTDLDLREEYANAFRTESYNDFWTRVLALSSDHGDSTSCKTMSSTTAARLPSYRLFAEHLLDPDQPTVTRILALTHDNHSLLTDYFAETANASFVCGSLLKDINRMRAKYRSTLKSLEIVSFSPLILTRLTHFSNSSSNPFLTSDSSPHRLQSVQLGCFDLLKRLELRRDKAQAKLRFINKLKLGSAISLVALTVTLTVIIVTHALAALVATPGIIVASVELVTGNKKLAKLSSQLDVAAKGTYILNRDLDTISRLVARLSDELEHMRTTAKFWLKRVNDKAQAVAEIARHLKKNESSFSQQLDELEEHLYLCFMTINRARNLVVKEITGPGQPI